MKWPTVAEVDVIAELVPGGIHACEAFGDFGPDAATPLFSSELAFVQGAFDERRREFTTVRGCARRALRGLGVAPRPLVPGPLGAPVWPAGVVGSMTHCPGYRAAVVARRADFVALGVDAEPCRPLPPVVAGRIVTAEEQNCLRQDFRQAAELPPDRLVFCAKEASYKAFAPWLGARYGVRDFRVRPAVDGTFQVFLPEGAECTSLPPTVRFPGRWAMRSGYLLTVVGVPADAVPEG